MRFLAHAYKLGPIDSATLDIAPLTVFVGPNGSGKSWLASALYGLTSVASRDSSELEVHGPLSEFIAQVLDTLVTDWRGRAHPGIENRVERDIGWDEIVAVSGGSVRLRAESKTLSGYLGIPDNGFVGAVDVQFPVVARQVPGDRPALRLRLDEREFQYTAHVALGSSAGRGVGTQASRVLDERQRTRMAKEIVGMLVLPFARSYYLPVERLAMMGGVGDERNHGFGRGIADAWAALQLGSAMRAGNTWRNVRPNIYALPKFRRVSGRHVEVTEERPAGRKVEEVLASGVRVPMEGAAAGSKALAALELVLSSANETSELFVIDEPELGLHPSLQLAVIELLATVANQGHHVILTTHSPFVVDHIVNLMTGASLTPAGQREFAKDLELQTTDALIHPDDVGVYLLEPGTLPRSILDRENAAVDWSTFGRISDRLGFLFNRALDLRDLE